MCGRFILGDSNWRPITMRCRFCRVFLKRQPQYQPTQSVSMAYMHNDILRADAARWWFVPHWHRGPAAD